MNAVFSLVLAMLVLGTASGQESAESEFGPVPWDKSGSRITRPHIRSADMPPSLQRAFPEASWYPMTGIPGAMVNALAIAPDDPAVMYAGTWGSGVYRSDDAGLNWQCYRSGSNGLVQSLQVDPGNPETAMALFASGGLYANSGLLRTTDGGRTWLPAVDVGRFEQIYDIAIHRFCPDTLYLNGRDSSYYSLFISVDNGLTWSTVSGMWGFNGLDFVPGHPDSVLALDYDDLYTSGDGGFSFSRVAFADYYGRLTDIRIDPQHPGVVYIAAEEGLLKTIDGCQTWEIIQDPFGYDPADSLSNPPELEHVALNTYNTSQLLVSTGKSELYESSDGGGTWSLRESPPFFPYLVRIYEVLFSPADTSYLIGTWWQGLCRLTSQGWSMAHNGLDNQFVSGIEIVNKNTIYMSELGNGFFFTADGGRTWEQRVAGLDSWHIREIVSHPSSPELLFAATYDHGFFRTENGGTSWLKIVGDIGEDGRTVCVSASHPDSLFAMGYNGSTDKYTLYRSTDSGQNWERIFAQDTSLYAIAVDPVNARHVLLATGYYSAETGYQYQYKLVESTDGGDTWDWAGADTLSGSVSDLLFLPDDHELLISTWNAGILARDDEGHWISRDTTGLPELADLTFIAVGPGEELVAGAWGGGVYRSWDRGYTWTTDTLGMGSCGPLTYSHKIIGTDTVQILGTYIGPYSYGYSVLGLEPDQPALPLKVALHPNYPNPFNPATTLTFELSRGTMAKLVVYDIRGRVVAEIVDGYRAAGHQQVVWNGRTSQGKELPSGVYLARLITPEYSKSIKMLLLK